MKETFYFSHDYNVRADEKIKKLLSIHGMLGYGVFWAIIEDLYQNANAMRTDYGCIAYDLRVEESLVKSIVNDFDLFQITGNYFGSFSVERRIKQRTERSQKARESALSRWSKQELLEEENANAMRTQCDPNAIKESILKDIKVKENKLKRNKRNNITPPSAESGTDCDEQSPKNNNSILDEKQKEKLRHTKRSTRLAEFLYEFLQEAGNMKLSKTKVPAWAKEFRLLCTENGVDYPRQKKALDWYRDHYSEQYVPVIESGASFRSKFIKLEAAMQRANQPKKNNNYTLGHLPKDPKDRIKYRDDGVLNSKGEFIPNTEPD